MSRYLKLNKFEKLSIDAELNDSETANRIRKILPLSNFVNTWRTKYIFL